jgi:predicted metalloprotease
MRTRAAALICSTVLAVLAMLASTASAQAQPPGAAPGAVPPDCSSLQGCYGFEQIADFYDEMTVWIGEFSKATYPDMSAPSYVYVESGTTVPTGCNVVLDSSAYAYCSLDDSVYIGQDQLWAFYSKQGDAAAAVGIAHEWGHHVQHVLGVAAAGRNGLIALENQADCIAGAWVGYIDGLGRLERDDLNDINAILKVIGAAEGPGRVHGTLAERTAAVQTGLRSGLTGCNSFFPGRPVLA